jgi:hypothetical protein
MDATVCSLAKRTEDMNGLRDEQWILDGDSGNFWSIVPRKLHIYVGLHIPDQI